MKEHYDLVIVGCGAAGMAAAATGAALGLSTAVIDEQASPGGQIYRAVERAPLRAILGEDYACGLTAVAALRSSGADILSSSTVWDISSGPALAVSVGGRSRVIGAKAVILATGAMERAVPVPGWTLPGVMTVGAAQILLKSSGTVSDRSVFAGSGPLLYLAAAQYIRAGVQPLAILDTTPRANYWQALPYLPAAMRNTGLLRKGLRLLRDIRKSGVPFIQGVTDYEASGEAKLRSVRYQRRGRWQDIETDHLFLHQGVIPNLNLTLAAGCRVAWNSRQQCWCPILDEWLRSSVVNIRIAGDAADIAGALGAAHRGRLAAVGTALDLGKIELNHAKALAFPERRHLAREETARPFLDTLYAPSMALTPSDDCTICRCENIPVDRIRMAVAQGAKNVNAVKSLTRCGMGLCQGRTCGPAVNRLIANTARISNQNAGHYRIRPPVKPVPWPELANLDTHPEPDRCAHATLR